MSNNALELRHVSRCLGDFELRDVNLTLPKGCILGLVGENGAGKSTTIRLLTGELRPDSGTVSVLDAEPGSPDFRAVKERLGVVLDDAWFPEILNARQVGTMMAMTYESWDAALYESYLTRFSLPPEKNFKDYSRGMRMKLAIAAALAHRPEVLLLDEATAGLDPIVRDEVLEIFWELNEAEDHAILISSHWRSSAITLPSSTRESSSSVRRRTACWKATASSWVPGGSWRSWRRTPSSPGRTAASAVSGPSSAGTPCPPACRWRSPRWRISSWLW